MKKFVKILTLTAIFVGLLCVLSAGFYLTSNFVKYSNLELDLNAITSSNISISIYDNDNKIINDENTTTHPYAKLSQMPPHTYQAFISIEDKNFYKHNGINLKRIAVATLKNIKNLSFSQGASTISQQLIKNTHLSSEKTIERKIKEIVLTRKLEKTLSKEEILESYLNLIYFGNNCYGVSSASSYYFSKECKDLNLEESALLAGLIKAPSKYSPITHPEQAKARRDLVLREMKNDKLITEEEFFTAKNKDIVLNLNSNNENRLNSYSEAVIDEAEKLLHLPAKQIALAGYKIHTYQDKDLQSKLVNSFNQMSSYSCDYAGIVLGVENHGVLAYVGKSPYKILEAKRQPGSCIKPVLVYAPAINEDIITPTTQILDEKIKIGEYSPENVNGKYNGYVSVKDAVAKSVNIPAIKVLSYVGIEKAKSYASQAGINFDKKDDSYALALGGMTYGVNLKDLCSAYSTFPNKGKFSEGRFISFITNKDGKIIYKHIPFEKTVFREDTSYLITDILKHTATEGTAKKLSSLGIEIASKTGTVGKKQSNQNLDAWNISYTPDTVCGVWMGNLDNTPIDIAGGNQPTEVVKSFYSGQKNKHFEKPNEVVEREIDLVDLQENHRVTLANKYTPERFKQNCLFSIFNLPSKSENFANLPKPQTKTKFVEGKNYIEIEAKKYLIYDIYDDNKNLIESISEKNETVEIMVNSDLITIKTKYIDSKEASVTEYKFKTKN